MADVLAGVLDQMARALDAVEAVAYGSLTVHARPPDALTPPAYLIGWGNDPENLTQRTACAYAVTVQVDVVAGRVDVAGGIDVADQMTEQLLVVSPFPLVRVSAPGALDVGNVRYLARRAVFQTIVNIGG